MWPSKYVSGQGSLDPVSMALQQTSGKTRANGKERCQTGVFWMT